jgi:hypothetical protein
MAGIQSLMPNNQQAPMPGQAQQAPLPGMMPQQSAATPSAMTGSLKNMPMEQLKMLFQNPQPNSPPLWAVISALAEKQKEAQAIQAAMGQGAMAQNAQMQQQPPVAAQVMQAAQGGIMQGYAGGGAVAFRRGGDVQHFSDGSKEFGVLSDPEAYALDALRSEQEKNKQKVRDLENSYFYLLSQNDPRAAQVKQQLDALSGRPSVAARPVPAPVPVMSPEAQALMRRQGPRWSQPEMKERMPEFAQRGTGGIGQLQFREKTSRPAPIPSSDLPPELLKAYAARDAQMRDRLKRPESLVAAEQGLASLARSNIEAQQAEAKAYADDIRAARDAALARSERDILKDPMALLTWAASIDTRKGKAVESFARGAAGLMGQREAAAEAARKEFAQAQRDERAMQANIRQTQMLEAQRQVALEQEKWNKVNEIDEKLAELRIKQEEFRLTRGDKAFDQAMKAKEVGIQESGLRLREREAARGPVPSFQDQLTKSAVESYLKQNPGKTMADAFEWLRGAGKPDRAALTYDQASDNVQKLLDSPNGMMEVYAIKQSAKKAGKPEPTLPEIKEMLIQRMLQDSRSRFAGQGSPTGAPQGTVDKNNPLLK